MPLARMRSRRCGRVAPDDIRQVLKLVTEHLKEVEDLNRNRHDVGPITGISAPVKRHAVGTEREIHAFGMLAGDNSSSSRGVL